MSNPFTLTSIDEKKDDINVDNTYFRKQSSIRNITDDNEFEHEGLADYLRHIPVELTCNSNNFNPFQFWNESNDNIKKWDKSIENGINLAIDKNHKGFNRATQEFSDILFSFTDTQERLLRLKNNLLETKKLLAQKNDNQSNSDIKTDQGNNNNNNKSNKTRNEMISMLYQQSLDCTKKLKELYKIEYFLNVTNIFDKYKSKLQYIHAAILLEDAKALYVTNLANIQSFNLTNYNNGLQSKKANLETELRKQLYQYIYFKSNNLRNYALKLNKNTIIHQNSIQQLRNIVDDSNINIVKLNRKKDAKIDSNLSIDNPYKVVVPIYQSFLSIESNNFNNNNNNNSNIYDDNNNNSSNDILGFNTKIGSSIQELLIEETSDSYLKNPTNDQKLFLRICSTAIVKLGRHIGTKGSLYKDLNRELISIIKRELKFSHALYDNTVESITPNEQSDLLLHAMQNIFKLYTKILNNHKIVINIFNKNEQILNILKEYTLQSVWNAMQKSMKIFLETYLNISQKSKNIPSSPTGNTSQFELDTLHENADESENSIISPNRATVVNNTRDNNVSSKNESRWKAILLRRSKKKDNTTNISIDVLRRGTVVDENATKKTNFEDILNTLTFGFTDSTKTSYVKSSAGLTMKYYNNIKPTSDSQYAAKNGTNNYLLNMSASNLNPQPLNNSRLRAPTVLGLHSNNNYNGYSNASLKRAESSASDADGNDSSTDTMGIKSSKPQINIAVNIFNKGKKYNNLIIPSEYHIGRLYTPIINFISNAQDNILMDDVKNNVNNDNLKEFVNNFVQNIFIPQILTSHANNRITQILLEESPYELIKALNENLWLYQSTVSTYDLIAQLFEQYKLLPNFDSNDFKGIIEGNIFSKFKTTYQYQLDEISKILNSNQLLKNEVYLNMLNKYDLRKMLNDNNNINSGVMSNNNSIEYQNIIDNLNDNTNIKEYEYYKHIIETNNESKKDDLLIFDTNCYSKLSLLARGLYWVSIKIQNDLIKKLIKKNKNENEKYKKIKNLSIYLDSKLEPLSETCISIIRMELRAQCCIKLRNMLKLNYWMPDDVNISKPQEYIITLNKLLVSCESKLNISFPENLVKFLFIELAYFICNIIIHLIPKIKNSKINHKGYQQLWRNIFSLQQNLTTITQYKLEKCFDKTQNYLEMSQKTPQQIEEIKQSYKKYSKNKRSSRGSMSTNGGMLNRKRGYSSQSSLIIKYHNYTQKQYDDIKNIAKLSQHQNK